MTIGTINPVARLLRGFAIDFLTAHQPAAAERIMDPAYCLTIGGHVFDGRDASYLPATLTQLEQFPGLCVTVHDVIIGEDALAMRFTEHGVSIRSPGRAAAWGGITLFRTNEGRLRHGWAEEDYFARKRQLKSGMCDAVRPPHPAPWDQPALAPDAATEAVALAMLADPAALLHSSCVEAICEGGPTFDALIEPETLTIDTLFTAGPRAAFHVACHGRYAGGFADVDAGLTGRPVSLPMAGMLTLAPSGEVERVQVAADRLGLQRMLLDMSRL